MENQKLYAYHGYTPPLEEENSMVYTALGNQFYQICGPNHITEV